MPNLHIACDFVFDVTRSLLIMQWTRCEYARTTRTRRWDGHLVFLLFLSIFLPLFYILTYLSLFFFIYFLAIFSSGEQQEKTVFHFEKIRAVSFSLFSILFSVFFFFSLLLFLALFVH